MPLRPWIIEKTSNWIRKTATALKTEDLSAGSCLPHASMEEYGEIIMNTIHLKMLKRYKNTIQDKYGVLGRCTMLNVNS